LPAGGHISYTWTEISVPPSSDGLTRVSRAVKTRILNDNSGHTSKWTYNWGAPSGTTLTNTVNDAAGNDTVHIFTALDGISSFYETTTQYFQGPQAGQPFKQVRQARRHLDPVRMRRDLQQGAVDIEQQGRMAVKRGRRGHAGHTGAIRGLCGAHSPAGPRSFSGAMRKPEACQRFLRRGIDFGRPPTRLCGAVWIIC